MWLCRWWCFVCTSDSFWCVFLPTFGSCFLQVDLPSNRSGNEDGAPAMEEVAKRNGGALFRVQWKEARNFAKAGPWQQISDFDLSIWQNWEFKSLDDTAPPRLILGWLALRSTSRFWISSFINHQIQLDALHRTHQFFQFVSDWQNEIWTDFCHFDILCDLPWRYHDIFPTYSKDYIHMFGFGRIWPRIACSMLPKFFRPAWKWSWLLCCWFLFDNHGVSYIFQQWDAVFFLTGKWENLSRLFWITRMGEVS